MHVKNAVVASVSTFVVSLALVALTGAGEAFAAPKADDVDFTIVSYNIKRGRGMDGKRDLTRTGGVIAKEKPRFVGIQEIDMNRPGMKNPDSCGILEKATGLRIHEGFGQTEMTLGIGNLIGEPLEPGSMGKPVPDYNIDLVDDKGNSVPAGENGEIVIRTPRGGGQPGIFLGYYKDEEKTAEAWRGGYYHTCDVAWKDEDGYYHYVGRADDVIKSSGYRIGPFEIENVIMELPYVVECGVSAAPDPVRGQVVKATIKLVPGKEPTEELKKEVQDYVKAHTAPYKYPRIVVFKDELPKTVSGKIQRNLL